MSQRQTPEKSGPLMTITMVTSSLVAFLILIVAVLLLVDFFAFGDLFEPRLAEHSSETPHVAIARGTIGLGVATVALALFTFLLFVAAARTWRDARKQLQNSLEESERATAEGRRSNMFNSANLALQLDNRFHSDRALRIRHGAVKFIAEHKKTDLEITDEEVLHDCKKSISPYEIDQELWCGLTSDLIDIFNYYDWIGYLSDKSTWAIDEEVVAQKFGPWIINYYQICEEEIAEVEEKYPARWLYLTALYKRLIELEEKDWNNNSDLPYPGARRETQQIKAFLQREHVRSHRGANPGSNTLSA